MLTKIRLEPILLSKIQNSKSKNQPPRKVHTRVISFNDDTLMLQLQIEPTSNEKRPNKSYDGVISCAQQNSRNFCHPGLKTFRLKGKTLQGSQNFASESRSWWSVYWTDQWTQGCGLCLNSARPVKEPYFFALQVHLNSGIHKTT